MDIHTIGSLRLLTYPIMAGAITLTLISNNPLMVYGFALLTLEAGIIYEYNHFLTHKSSRSNGNTQ